MGKVLNLFLVIYYIYGLVYLLILIREVSAVDGSKHEDPTTGQNAENKKLWTTHP